ncbi:MAG: flagellar biosynthesis regulator FlaF [Gemmobacter sp.]
MRAQLFYLYEFTAAHSRRVLDGTASVEALVDVNTAMMRGLRGAAVSP